MPTIAMMGFDDKDERVLKSVIALITPYLRETWSLGPRESATVLFANAETIDLLSHPPLAHGRVIPCVLRPSRYPVKAMHWPFRAYEVLALLNDLPPADDTDAAASSNMAAADDLLRWVHWPEDCVGWRLQWRRLGAALARRSMRFSDWVESTGAPHADASKLLALGLAEGFIHRESAPPASSASAATYERPVPLAANSWLGSIVGRLRRRLTGEA